MATAATAREKRDPVFAAAFRGMTAAFYGIPMHDCPYEARTGEADAWELAHGRASQMLSDRETMDCGPGNHDYSHTKCPKCGFDSTVQL